MDDSVIRIALLLFAFAGISSTLHVTPNSPCSKICLNDAGVSNISGPDISCSDEDYSKPLGKKFQKCVECLQTSSFGTDDENDQGWLLYNLRFAADWCMFAQDNSQRISGPCMDSVTCGGLEAPLDVDNGDPKNSTIFNYCENNSGRFPSEAAVCNDCLQHMPENKYLSNWIVALEAGCSQRPSQKVLLGLTGSFFSDETVSISAPLSPDDPKLNLKNKKEGLPMQAIIGIIVGAVIITLMIIGVVGWKCWKKRKVRKLADMNSKCHSRFGAVDIPAPLDGAYSEYKREPVVEVAPWDEDYMMKEMRLDSRTSEHTKQSSISSDNSNGSLNPQKDQTKAISKQASATQNEPSQHTKRPSQESVVQKVRSDPSPKLSAASPEPERSLSQINPLRMNSFQQHRASVVSVGVAVTAPHPVDMPTPSQFLPPRFTPTPPRHTPTPPQLTRIPPPPAQLQARSTRSARKPPLLTLNNAQSNTSTQAQSSPQLRDVSSIISSTSTTFSPGVYHSPPPSYQSPVRSTFTQTNQLRPQQRPTIPLAAYNPADYASKPTNPYKRPQPQFNTQQRSYSPSPLQPSHMAFHLPQASVASTSSRFSFASSIHMPSPPPPPPQPKQQLVPKQNDNAVPIIAMPIPAPKRKTVDMRNLVGMNLKQHISPDEEDVPAMPTSRSQEADSKGLDHTESLLAKSPPPFRTLARNLNPEVAMTLPEAEKRPAPTLDEGTIQVQRPDSRASYRGRSVSRPRRENIPHEQGSQDRSGRDRPGSRRLSFRSRSRDVDLEGGDGRKRALFSFGFRGQDALNAVDSPESGNRSTDVEQWPGKM